MVKVTLSRNVGKLFFLISGLNLALTVSAVSATAGADEMGPDNALS